MATINDIVKLAVDSYKGVPMGEFSAEKVNNSLNKSLIEVNNGKSYLDYRDVRDGKCAGLFSIIEEIVVKTVIDGLQGNEFFMNLVDYKNLALGDMNEFYIPDDSLLYISEIADGNKNVRRQRLTGGETISVKTRTYGARFYDELNRVLAGRVDLNEMINKMGNSLLKGQYEAIFAAWTAMANNTGSLYIPTVGSYSEAALLELCEHVEVNNDTTPIIFGTREGLRKITTANVSEKAKESLYDIGFYGKFNGIPLVRLKQFHKTNTDEFGLPNNQLYIMGVDTKPIKYVNEGQSLIVTNTGSDTKNGDFTQDYMIINKAGIGIMTGDKKFGIYTLS